MRKFFPQRSLTNKGLMAGKDSHIHTSGLAETDKTLSKVKVYTSLLRTKIMDSYP